MAPARARAALAVTREARGTSIDGATAHPACSGLSSCATQCRAVPGTRALSCRAVPLWRCSSRASSARSRCCGSHARNVREPHRQRHSTRSGPGGWRPPPELGTFARWCLAPRRIGACALSCRNAPHRRCCTRASSARSRCCRARSCRLALPRDATYPAGALYLAVLSHTAGAPAVPPAYARAAVAVTQGTLVNTIHSATAHGAGLAAGARLPSLALSSHGA